MAKNSKGEVVPNVGYKLTNIDDRLLGAYNSLNRGEQRWLKKEAKKYDETKYSYLEEILIDYEKAFNIATDVLYKLDVNISSDRDDFEDLVMIILFCGIGVFPRTPMEISLVSGISEETLESAKERLLEEYKDNLVEIYDKVWQVLNMKETQSIEIMSL